VKENGGGSSGAWRNPPFSHGSSHCRRHVGIYAYRCAYLRRFVDTAPSSLEQIESLEQLRALAHNAKIIVADAVAHCGVGVDTPADYERLTAYV
jgi:3-deoxy-manno-octulosonate cytidylyltransferase (CMP-KDO synthetase)